MGIKNRLISIKNKRLLIPILQSFIYPLFIYSINWINDTKYHGVINQRYLVSNDDAIRIFIWVWIFYFFIDHKMKVLTTVVSLYLVIQGIFFLIVMPEYTLEDAKDKAILYAKSHYNIEEVGLYTYYNGVYTESPSRWITDKYKFLVETDEGNYLLLVNPINGEMTIQ